MPSKNPEMVALARALRGADGRPRSLRSIARELAAAGYLNQCKRPFSANSAASMVGSRKRIKAARNAPDRLKRRSGSSVPPPRL